IGQRALQSSAVDRSSSTVSPGAPALQTSLPAQYFSSLSFRILLELKKSVIQYRRPPHAALSPGGRGGDVGDLASQSIRFQLAPSTVMSSIPLAGIERRRLSIVAWRSWDTWSRTCKCTPRPSPGHESWLDIGSLPAIKS